MLEPSVSRGTGGLIVADAGIEVGDEVGFVTSLPLIGRSWMMMLLSDAVVIEPMTISGSVITVLD